MSMFRLLGTGSRDWDDTEAISRVCTPILWHLAPGSTLVVIDGKADGFDCLLYQWAVAAGQLYPVFTVLTERYAADWHEPCVATCAHPVRRKNGRVYCPGAGGRRNQRMVDSGADVCVAAPLPGSVGTLDCMRRARTARIPIIKIGE